MLIRMCSRLRLSFDDIVDVCVYSGLVKGLATSRLEANNFFSCEHNMFTTKNAGKIDWRKCVSKRWSQTSLRVAG